jgi:hypothetical protein
MMTWWLCSAASVINLSKIALNSTVVASSSLINCSVVTWSVCRVKAQMMLLPCFASFVRHQFADKSFQMVGQPLRHVSHVEAATIKGNTIIAAPKNHKGMQVSPM